MRILRLKDIKWKVICSTILFILREIIVKYEVDYGVLLITYNKLEPVDYADLLGQWEVDKFAATYNNGKKFSTFSDDVFENELKGLRRIELTEDTLTMIESKTLLPYTIENGNLVLSSSLSFFLPSYLNNHYYV